MFDGVFRNDGQCDEKETQYQSQDDTERSEGEDEEVKRASGGSDKILGSNTAGINVLVQRRNLKVGCRRGRGLGDPIDQGRHRYDTGRHDRCGHCEQRRGAHSAHRYLWRAAAVDAMIGRSTIADFWLLWSNIKPRFHGFTVSLTLYTGTTL